MNPFDDPEILLSVQAAQTSPAAAQVAQVPVMRPPLAGSPAQAQGHRSSRTLCTSELSSVAARAAAISTSPAGGAQNQKQKQNLDSSPAASTPRSTPPDSASPYASPSVGISPSVPNKETVQALAELAAALSSAKPTAESMARVTLGEYAAESTGSKKSHAKKKGHRRLGSQGSAGSGGGGGGGGLGGGMGSWDSGAGMGLSPGSSLTGKSKKSGGGHRHSKSMDKLKSLLTSSPSPSSKNLTTSSPLPATSPNSDAMLELVDSINEAGGGSRKNSIVGSVGRKFGSFRVPSPRGSAMRKGSIGGSSSRDRLDSVGSGTNQQVDGETMRDMYQARRQEVDATAAGGNPFVSETSLLGTDFIPSMPDLGGLMDLGGERRKSNNTFSDDAASEGSGSLADEDDKAKTVEAQKGEDEKEDDAFAITSKRSFASKRDSVTHLPPPSAVASQTLPSMRSSEQDPAAHQVEIPPVDDFVLHARLCSVLDEYREVDQNFEFASLVGLRRQEMRLFVDESADAGNNTTVLQQSQIPIVSSILECGDDLVVEGFVHEVGSCSHGDAQDDTGTARDKSPDDRVEVTIFYSARHRQFIVSWRGSSVDQAKPVRNRHLKHAKDMLAHDPHSANLSADQAVPVFPAYRDAYFKPGIEESVFTLLDKLADRTPFCDVVMTGHSFGAALATLAGARYASSRHQIRVCCNLFGSPKVGGVEFRHWANSLPNLKVMRVEYGSDPWVAAPEGTAWSHVGHSIVIDSAVTSVSDKGFKMGSLHPKIGDKVPIIARAYRFDQHRSHNSASKQFLSSVAKSMTGGHHSATKSEKNDHELSGYVYAVERIATLKIPWVSDFVGEDTGEGVVGIGHDRRMFV